MADGKKVSPIEDRSDDARGLCPVVVAKPIDDQHGDRRFGSAGG